MSEWKMMFTVSLGYVGGDVEEEFDLVDDLDFDPEDLEGKTEEQLQEMVEGDLRDWHQDKVEYWAECI